MIYFETHMSEVPQESGARLLLERSKKTSTHEERVAFGFLAVCGVGAVIFGSLFFFSNVKKPFLVSYTGPRYSTSAEKESEEIALQRIADTDADGISDYDELHIFSTSPYIADTDSDGRADGIEIGEGGDPNCALGKTCASSELLQAGAVADFLASEAPVAENTSTPTLVDTVGALQQLSVGEVREFLLSSGMDAATLDALSDEQVMTVYLDALGQAATSLQEDDASTDTSVTIP